MLFQQRTTITRCCFKKKIAIFCMLICKFTVFSDFYQPHGALGRLDTHHLYMPKVFRVTRNPSLGENP